MIKAVFFDVDGTLLSHKTRRVPDSTIQAFKLLKEKGILTFIASGRHISELADLPLAELEFDGYLTLNGQYCYNGRDVYYANPIPREDIINLINWLNQNPRPCIFIEDELFYINYIDEKVRIAQEAISSPLPPINDLTRGYQAPIYQVIPYDITVGDEEILSNIMPYCKLARWHKYVVDVMPATGGKQKGIEKTLEYYRLRREEIMAFGDGDNDVDMLEIAGLGIAMGNSSSKLLAVADYVTADIDDDGIFLALQRYKVV